MPLRPESEFTKLLAYHEAEMKSAEKRGEYYSDPRHEDQGEQLSAEHNWHESNRVAEVLRWALGLETNANNKHLFEIPPRKPRKV